MLPTLLLVTAQDGILCAAQQGETETPSVDPHMKTTAVAVAMFCDAVLLHDDVSDHDAVRRDRAATRHGGEPHRLHH